MTINSEQLAEVFESPQCFCGNVKKMQHALCTRCFYLLPEMARQFVAAIPNETNVTGAYDAALEWLRRHANVNPSPA